MEEKKDLQTVVAESGLAEAKSKYLLENFSAYAEIASEWETRALEISVENEHQVAEMAKAREGRLLLRQKRIAIEKARVSLKAESLKEGRTIDAIAKALTGLITPIEEYLGEQEHFAENLEKAREKARQEEAEKLLREKEEKERLEREAREREEREAREAENKRIREENERLQKEADERDAEIRKERQLFKAQLVEERAAREKAEREEADRIRVKERLHQEEFNWLRAERKRLAEEAARVTCPECGHVFLKE